jgi:Dyp-type peroxidase family
MNKNDLFADVQGNILKGFNKPEIRFIFFDLPIVTKRSKKWFREFALCIPSTVDLIKYSEDMKNFSIKSESPMESNKNNSIELRQSAHKPLQIWYHISFTKSFFDKIGLLAPISPSTDPIFPENDPFYQGMKKRSLVLGDIGRDNATNPETNWVEPFKSSPIDGMIIVAADKENDADAHTTDLISILGSVGIRCVGLEKGSAIKNSAGKQIEHFGFRDGVSQPLIIGIDDEEINQRKENPDSFEPVDFVLSGLTGSQAWANYGSFLVFRKLGQDVDEFWKFMESHSKSTGMTPEKFAAKFIGRWKSGAPLALFPDSDPEHVNHSDLNDFKYFRIDKLGTRTPRFSHIRKSAPRDDGRIGSPDQDESSNKNHRILRRGITYGPVTNIHPSSQRGLLFVCYQKDLIQQFEFIQKNWVNNPKFPIKDGRFDSENDEKSGHIGHGIDAIIGLNRKTIRDEIDGEIPYVTLIKKNTGTGDDAISRIDGYLKPDITTGFKQWVHTHGGQYFFSPSISALRTILFE